MPYVIREEDGKFCLYKPDGDSSLGCHDSKAAAQAQMAALYAADKKDRPLFIEPVEAEQADADVPVPDESPETEAQADTVAPTEDNPVEAVSVEEMKATEADAPEPEVEVWKDVAVGNLSAAAVEDTDDPAFWDAPASGAENVIRVTVTDSSNKQTEAVFTNGTSVTLTTSTDTVAPTIGVDLAREGARDKSAITTLIPDALDRAKGWLLKRRPQVSSDVKVVGNHWFLTHSNNFKDRDAEIFPLKAIDRYVARTEAGIVPLPELWVWHAGKQVRIGEAEMVARHGHFVLAAGTFDTTPQGQKARDYYARNGHKTRVSHGFTFDAARFDGRHYHDFNTFEISLLPRGVEANLFTSLEGVKAMAVKPEQLKYLEEVLGKEFVAEKLADLEARGKALEELGVEFKDFADVTPAAAVDDGALNDGVKALISDLIEDNGTAVSAALDALREVKALKVKVKQLEDEIGGRPRKASEAPETELTADNVDERMADIRANIVEQTKKTDKFWNTETSDIGD